MALLSNAKGRRKNQSESGYTRVFGNSDLGNLISRIHATKISFGSELERHIWDHVQKIENLDLFLKEGKYPNGVHVANKSTVKKSQLAKDKYEPDFLAFKITENKRQCYLLEVKDGDQFDTKKSLGEKNHLENFRNHISKQIEFPVSIAICCFHASKKEDIISGFKKKISQEEALTGRELCSLLEIDYDQIIHLEKSDRQQNLQCLAEEIVKIPALLDLIKKHLP